MRWLRLILALFAMMPAVVRGADTVSPPAAVPTYHVTRPGQEDVVRRMLKPDAGLPRGWRLAGASIEQERVVGRYQRAGVEGQTEVILEHPDAAPDDAVRTQRFAVRLAADGPAAGELLDRLVASIRKHELAWQWEEREVPEDLRGGSEDTGSLDLDELVRTLWFTVTKGDHDETRKQLEALGRRAAELPPGLLSVRIAVERGAVLQAIGAADEARTAFQQASDAATALATAQPEAAAELEPLRWRILQGLGQRAAGDELGVRLLAERTDPAQRCPLVTLGHDLVRLGEADAALAWVRRVVAGTGCPAATYQEAARVAESVGRLVDLEALVLEGGRRFPDDFNTQGPLANLYKQKGQWDEARRVLEQLVANGHREGGLLGSLLGIYSRERVDPDQLAEMIARADKDPEDVASAFFAGALAHYANDFATAIPYLLRAHTKLANEPRVPLYLAMSYHHRGDSQRAKRFVAEAVEVGGTDPDVFYCRALIYLESDPALARDDLRRYLSMTATAKDIPPAKQERVGRMVAALDTCLAGPEPAECVREALGYHSDVAAPEAPAKTGDEQAGLTPDESVMTLFRTPDGALYYPGRGWKMAPPEALPDRIRVVFESPSGDRVQVYLVRRGSVMSPYAQTASFDLFYEGELSGQDDQGIAVIDGLVELLKRNDKGEAWLPALRPQEDIQILDGLVAQMRWLAPRDLYQVLVVLLLLLVGGVALVSVATVTARSLATRSRGERWGILAAFGAAALIRVLVPTRLVSIFMGYKAVEQAVDFAAVPRYGAGAFVLERLALGWFSPDHLTILWLNTVLGILTIPVVVALSARYLRDRWAPLAIAVMLAIVPVFIKDHRSESNLVITMFFLWSGALLWDTYLERHRLGDLVGAAALMLLAVTSRPEILLVAPALALALAFGRGLRAGFAGQTARLLVVGAATAALAVPHILHMIHVVPAQIAAGALPSVDAGLPTRILHGLFLRNLVLLPTLFPAAVTLLAAVGLFLVPSPQRRLLVGLLVVAVLWLASYFVDLPLTSVPRLHVPAAVIVVILAGAGVGRIARALRERISRPSWRIVLGGSLAVVTALTAVPSAFALWAPTNEDEEEAFLREAYPLLPSQDGCVIRIGDQDDPPAGKTHRYHPDYLARRPHHDLRVLSITEWESEPGRCGGQPYFLFGLRCYARHGRRAPENAGWPEVLSSCARLRVTNELEPVLERDLPNHGNNEFGYYPKLPSFRVGLYKVHPKS